MPAEKQSPAESIPASVQAQDSPESEKPASPPEATAKGKPDMPELKPQDLEEAVKIYDAIRNIRKKQDPERDKQLTQELDRRMAEIISRLKDSLRASTPVALRNAAILKAKAALVRMSFDKMLEGVADRQSEAVWKSIRLNYETVINGLVDIVESLKPSLTNGATPAEKDGERQDLIEAAKAAERELQISKEQRESLERTFVEEKAELLSRVAALEEENRRLSSSDSAGKPTYSQAKSHAAGSGKDSGKKRDVSVGKKPQQQNSPESAAAGGVPAPSKSLTLKQLKDLIADMYAQKEKYDQKCTDNKLPRETMEQYMYVYLNQIYGLKSLIIEGAAGIIHGIKRYSVQDNDVALFGKILRNECDEDFRLVFGEVKVAMGDILKETLKKKFKHKGEPELEKMVREIQQGDIEEAYWLAIIKKMYNEEHYSILSQKIKERIDSDRNSIKTGDKRLTREQLNAMKTKYGNKLPCSELQKVLYVRLRQ